MSIQNTAPSTALLHAALAYAARGWRVALTYQSNAGAAEEVVKKIRAARGTAIAVQADVGVEAGGASVGRVVVSPVGTSIASGRRPATTRGRSIRRP